MAVFAPVLLIMAAATTTAQAPRPAPEARRITDRMRALQREAEQLANESRTLLGDLRRLEVERDLRTAEALQAEAAATQAQGALDRARIAVAELEARHTTQLPDLRRQMVDLYKRGRTGYAQLLFGARDARDFRRATRAVAALSAMNQRRLEEHRRTLDRLRAERAALDRQARDLLARQQEAARARIAAERAIAARSELIARIDSRRDLAAQYAGELQVASERLQQQLQTGARAPVDVPLAPFRGALDWPVPGRVAARFGTREYGPGAGIRNGIEIAAADGTPVHAVHGGTVAFAGPFTGFGTLVILDHGANNFTLYGYLGSLMVDRGDTVEAGAELGRSGPGPAATPALYFEVRIDGRSVDPLQWLKPRG